ncbi:MAG TPA: hypothetical protein PKY44_01680 [Bacteroidales bacterium]|nr:hypothetical protein [Bacteroidales bacterium]
MFKKVIESNRRYWRHKNDDNYNGILLFEAFYPTEQIFYGIAKTALVLAKHLNLKPVIIEPVNISGNYKIFVESMCHNRIKLKYLMLRIILSKVLYIWSQVKGFKSKDDILAIKVDKYRLGEYIYDGILSRNSWPEILKVNFHIKLLVLFELLHFHCFMYIFKTHNVQFVVIGDNVYRWGLLFEICKRDNISCVPSIDLNTYSLAKFTKVEDFNNYSRHVSEDMINELANSPNVIDEIDRYFQLRFEGNIEQHDVINAYKNKGIINRDLFKKKYNLDPHKKLTILMAHIFCDAPHGYPNTLFQDYFQWMEETIKGLLENKSIQFLIKEHPSADLYNEQGLVFKLLEKYNIESKLISKDESTYSVLLSADSIITCGGTIGIEMACYGKPTLLAAKPPYAQLGFTIDPRTKTEYIDIIKNNIQNYNSLTSEQILKAKKTAYILFYLFNTYDEDLEIGPEKIYKGRNYNNELFYSEILRYNKTDILSQKISHQLKKFINSKYNVHIKTQ